MTNLRDLLESLKPKRSPSEPPKPEEVLRREERHAAILAGSYPADGAEIERVSEYRLSSLLQYPHY
jgi:hypothetical protein